jgi:hypothetical protein
MNAWNEILPEITLAGQLGDDKGEPGRTEPTPARNCGSPDRQFHLAKPSVSSTHLVKALRPTGWIPTDSMGKFHGGGTLTSSNGALAFAHESGMSGTTRGWIGQGGVRSLYLGVGAMAPRVSCNGNPTLLAHGLRAGHWAVELGNPGTPSGLLRRGISLTSGPHHDRGTCIARWWQARARSPGGFPSRSLRPKLNN